MASSSFSKLGLVGRLLVILGASLVLATGLNGAPAAPAAAPRNDAWVVLGPGGGGAQYIPTISPHGANDVLVRCDMTGIYLSHDAGHSWRMLNLRGGARWFVFDPIDPKIIYISSGSGLYRSVTRGDTWKLVIPDPSNVVGSVMPGDHAGERLVTKDGSRRRVGALAIDPADSRTLYAVIDDGGASALHVSHDFGKTWRAMGTVTGRAPILFIDKASPQDNRTVYLLAAGGVSRLQDGKWTRHAGPRGINSFSSFSGGFNSKTGKPVFYATVGGGRGRGRGAVREAAVGIFVSRDGGATWENTTAAVGGASGSVRRVGPMAASTNFGEIAYVMCSISTGAGRGFSGLARTGDAGTSWTLVENQSARPDESPGGPWFYALYSRDARVAFTHLGVGPNHPDVIYGTDLGRTMKSDDGGKHWLACYSDIQDNGSVTTRGLDVTTCYGYHVDPFDNHRHFITYTDIGLFRSEDGGTHWMISTEGVPRAWRNTTYWMEFDPKVQGLVWAVFGRNHDLPRPKMWRTTDPSRFEGGVGISTDGGRTWVASAHGMPETACTHILMDPASPVGSRTLYVCGFGTGVWKSTDNGNTWQLKNRGVAGAQPFAWWIDCDRNGVLYLTVARRSDDGSYGNEQDGALYRSTDGAESWTRLPLPQGVNGPNGIEIDPSDPNRLYLACWGRDARQRAVNGGILLSTDGGATWTEVLTQDQHIYDVTIDPRNANVAYACGFEHNAWRSQDRGETWSRIRGFNFKWGHRVIPDPADPAMIYVTTFGGSVWHGPAEGDPNAAEDIVTPEVAYGK